jgi:IclR family pca regulon transcriptional regulator
MEKRARALRQQAGSRLPAHAASTGHVLLAHLPAERLEAYLAQAPFPTFTARTPTTAAESRAVLAAVRDAGFAGVTDVIEYGVVAVAVPIRDADGRVFAAINCSADTVRVRLPEMVETRLPALRGAADEIGAALRRMPALAHSVAG